MDINQYCVEGNLTRDPELRFGEGSGTPWCTFTVARDTSVKEAGEWKEGPTEWFDCKAFGSLAENIAESLAKGDRVLVVGRLVIRPYERKDGTDGKSIDLVVDAAGPSLKWASTAGIIRNSKSDGGQRSQQAAPEPSYAEGEKPF